MRGYAETPEYVVDQMVAELFRNCTPRPNDWVLDPGCGEGSLIAGVLRYCQRHQISLPHIAGVESDPKRVKVARRRFAGEKVVEIHESDFLERPMPTGSYRYVIANPPYVGLPKLSEEERRHYRCNFWTAYGRFDLYFLFWERSLELLASGGKAVFVTPEKWLYVESASRLRTLLGKYDMERIELLAEDAFEAKAAYPCVATVSKRSPRGVTSYKMRDGATGEFSSRNLGGGPWWPRLNGRGAAEGANGVPLLMDLALRISAGVATGADEVFVRPLNSLSTELQPFVIPTLSGRELETVSDTVLVPRSTYGMLTPYHQDGRLMAEHELGPLYRYFRKFRGRLEARSCAKRKHWYAFHDSVPIRELLRPKILCKDISRQPRFWIDRSGMVLPRHSVYYIVPKWSESLDSLAAWLNSPVAQVWLKGNCHRAANGYLRLQTRTLRSLPLTNAPDELTAGLSVEEA